MKKRIDSLNFIRILGMTAILLFHAWLMYGFHTGISWLDTLISIGAIFVTVFFMLSGFGLRKSNKILRITEFRGELFSFYKNRILSFYPLFLLLTVVALLFQFRLADSWTETIALLPIQLSGLHILLGERMHGFLFNDNCWYISALFVLYLLFPFLNMLVDRLSRKGKMILIVLLWLGSFLVYSGLIFGKILRFTEYYTNPFLRIPEFFIGMLLADLVEEGKILRKREFLSGILLAGVSVVTSVILLALYPHFHHETNLYGIVVIPATCISIFILSHWENLNRLGSKKVIRWLSSLGLEMYLCQSFATLTLTLIKVDGNWDEIAFILLTILFAVFVHTCFTTPIKKWRGRS